MARIPRALHELQMASPCSANWDEMKGNGRVRQCHKCRLYVYRVSDLTREEAEEIVADAEGMRCTSLYRRQDGTVLVEDCPKGVAAARKAARWWKERMFHLLLLLLPWIIIALYTSIDYDTKQGHFSLADIEPFKSVDTLLISRPKAPGGLKPLAIGTPLGWPPPNGAGGPVFLPPDDPEWLPPVGDVPDPIPHKPQ